MLDSASASVIYADTSRIVSIDKDQAVAYAQKAFRKGSTRGLLDSYRYSLKAEDGTVRITFLDCGRKLDAFRGFLLASVGISLLGLLVVFTLITFFSGRIIRPISESYEKQKHFITDAGHEIKTPLTIIGADADVLSMELGENEWLEDIRRQTKRLTALTNDLVLLSRMEEAESSMQMLDFSFSDTVSEAAASFQALAQTQGKAFLFRVPPLLTLRGNENAIAQLVSILLDNALKYSPPGGSVSLTAEKQGKQLRLSVYNTAGQEIPRESLPLLFDRFYRIDPSRNSQTGGHGIGLSVAKAIVTAHGGTIHAASEDGLSLLITVQLPV